MSNSLYNSVALPLQSSLQLVDHDESFPVLSSDLFEADMWTANQPSVSSRCFFQNNSLHIYTHHFNIKVGDIYRIFRNTAMRTSTTFEAL